MVEIFFGIITRQAIRRGTFTSVRELVQAISRYIKAWNERCGHDPRQSIRHRMKQERRSAAATERSRDSGRALKGVQDLTSHTTGTI